MAKRGSGKRHDGRSGRGRQGSPAARDGSMVEPGPGNILGRRATLICVGVIVAVALVLFHRAIFAGEILVGGDVLAGALIFEDYAESRMAAGALPFWNPYIFSGMPFFESMTWNGIVYPSYWIGHFLATVPGVELPRLTFIVLHYILAGLGTFAYLRSRRVGHVGALAGGLAFMLTPHFIGLAGIGHGGKVLTGAYIPLVLLAAHNVLERGRLRWLGLLGLFGGLQFLARHIQVSYFTWMAVGLLIVYHVATELARGRDWRPLVRRSLMVIGAGVLAVAIAGILLVPLQSYADFSTRASEDGGMGIRNASMWSFHPKEILTFFVPSAFGLANETYWGPMPGNQVTHSVGFIVLALAFIGVFARRDRNAWFLGVLAAVFLVLSFGKYLGPLYTALYNVLPGFSRFRVPALFLLFTQFALAALAGHGVSALLGEVRRRRTRWLIWAAGVTFVGALIGIIVLLARPALEQGALSSLLAKNPGVSPADVRPYASIAARMAARDAGILIAFAFAAGVGVLVASVRKLPALIPAALLLGVVVWELWVIDARFLDPQRMQPLEHYYPRTQAVEYLSSREGKFRVLPLGRDFTSNALMVHRIESISGYHAAKLASYDELLWRIGFPGGRFPDLRFLMLTNVRYVLGPDQDLGHPAFTMVAPGVHEFLYAMPRATLLGDVHEVSSEGLVLGEMRTDGFNPMEYAIVQGELPGPVMPVEGGTARITTHEPERIVVEARAPQPCLLYLSEVYYPNGWSAFVDGEEATIYRTNYAFRSVYLEAGDHTVEFVYRPRSVRQGLWLTIIGLAAAAALVLVPARRGGDPRGAAA